MTITEFRECMEVFVATGSTHGVPVELGIADLARKIAMGLFTDGDEIPRPIARYDGGLTLRWILPATSGGWLVTMIIPRGSDMVTIHGARAVNPLKIQNADQEFSRREMEAHRLPHLPVRNFLRHLARIPSTP